MYVVVEGIDTAGKSTQLDILKEKYKEAIFTKEPGGTKIGLKLRQMALNGEAKSKVAEMFLFLADRAEHMEEIIKPNESKLVISDRSVISGIAYASNLPLEIVVSLNLIATQNILPSHVILLELSKEELIRRLGEKKHDSIESRGIEYLLDIQDRMKKTVEMLKINHLFIDASLDIKQIAKKIEEFINE
ncbi:MAG: dTMP kinase [Halarcobacter sp.]